MTLAERFFKEELEVFENDDIQEFCIELLDTAPTYFWQVSASSTNKYHPDYTVGFMGLAKHVKGATRFFIICCQLIVSRVSLHQEKEICYEQLL